MLELSVTITSQSLWSLSIKSLEELVGINCPLKVSYTMGWMIEEEWSGSFTHNHSFSVCAKILLVTNTNLLGVHSKEC